MCYTRTTQKNMQCAYTKLTYINYIRVGIWDEIKIKCVWACAYIPNCRLFIIVFVYTYIYIVCIYYTEIPMRKQMVTICSKHRGPFYAKEYPRPLFLSSAPFASSIFLSYFTMQSDWCNYFIKKCFHKNKNKI